MFISKLDLYFKTQMCAFFLFSIIILNFENNIFTHLIQNTYVLAALIKLPKYVNFNNFNNLTFKHYLNYKT